MKIRKALLEGIGKLKVVDRQIDVMDSGILVKPTQESFSHKSIIIPMMRIFTMKSFSMVFRIRDTAS